MQSFQLVPLAADKNPPGEVSNVRHIERALQRTYFVRSCRHALTAWRTSWPALIFDVSVYDRTHVVPYFVKSQLSVPSNGAGQTGPSWTFKSRTLPCGNI
jgi:hypothetical protein